jgi:hypothetical protein
MEKGDSYTPPPGSIRGLLDDLGRHRAAIFSVFGCPVGGRRDDRHFDDENVHTRTAQCAKTAIKTMVFERFHWSENDGFWVPRAWILGHVEIRWDAFGPMGDTF